MALSAGSSAASAAGVAAGAIGDVIKATLQKTAAAVAGIMRGVGGTVTAGVKVAEGLGAAAAAALARVGQAVAAFQRAAAQTVRFVDQFNPAAVQRFQLAVNDLTAVVGRVLVPLLEGMTRVVRAVGSALYGASAAFDRVFEVLRSDTFSRYLSAAADGLAGLMSALGTAFGAVMAAAEPLLRVVVAVQDALLPVLDVVARVAAAGVGAAMSAVVPVLDAAAKGVVALVEGLKQFVEWVGRALDAIGIHVRVTPGEKAKDNTGQSVRAAQWGTAEGALRSAMTAALGPTAGDPARVTARATTGIEVKLSGALAKVAELAEWAGSFFAKLWGGISAWVNAVATRAYAKTKEWAEWGSQKLSAVWEWATKDLWGNIKTLPAMLWGFLSKLPEQIANALRGVIPGVGAAVSRAADAAGGWTLGGTANAMKAELRDAYGSFRSALPSF